MAVKARAYKIAGGRKYYGAWSKTKTSGRIKQLLSYDMEVWMDYGSFEYNVKFDGSSVPDSQGQNREKLMIKRYACL